MNELSQLSIEELKEKLALHAEYLQNRTTGERLTLRNTLLQSLHIKAPDTNNSRIYLEDITLENVHFQDCTLENIFFSCAKIRDTTWDSCVLRQCIFRDTTLINTTFNRTNLSYTVWNNIEFTKLRTTRSTFLRNTINNSTFNTCTLSYPTNFYACDIINTTFPNSAIGGLIQDSDLYNTHFYNCDTGCLTLAATPSNQMIQYQNDKWPVLISPNWIQIGCKGYTFDKWMRFTNDKINAMSSTAIEWYMRHKDIIAILHAHLLAQLKEPNMKHRTQFPTNTPPTNPLTTTPPNKFIDTQTKQFSTKPLSITRYRNSTSNE